MIIFVTFCTGYCGSDNTQLYRVNEVNAAVEEELYVAAIENAEQYGYEMCTDDCEDDDCDMEHPGSTGIDYDWVEYDPEKHDSRLLDLICHDL